MESVPPRRFRRVRKLLGLSGSERRLLLAAGATVAAVRVGLWLVPFKRLQGLVTGGARGRDERRSPHPPERIAWAVAAAARCVPRASCLTQALAAQRLLERAGHAPSLRIGVGKGEQGELIAHAWVDLQGEVLIGGGELEKYTPLAALGRLPPRS